MFSHCLFPTSLSEVLLEQHASPKAFLSDCFLFSRLFLKIIIGAKMFFVPALPEQSAVAAAPASSPLPLPPQINITIPFATACYSSAGFHVTYCMRISDLTKDIVWLTHQRYSSFRALHTAVGKHYVTGVSFPGMLMTSRGNRNKNEITIRREKLEKYMQRLVDTVFNASGGEKPLHRVAKLLQFLEHPFEGEWARSSLTVDFQSDLTSTISETVPSAKNGKISALEQPKVTAPPVVITSRWRAPAALPGAGIGLGMPFVTVAQTIDGDWEMLIKGDKQLRKGLLRHRYDEAAAMCSFMATQPSVMDAAEAQDFIVEFRRKHPLAAYLRLEKALECQSPTSASRSDRSSQLDPRSTATRHQTHDHRQQGDDEEDVGSPVVHYHRGSAVFDTKQIFASRPIVNSPSFIETGVAHYNLRRDYLSVPKTLSTVHDGDGSGSPTATSNGSGAKPLLRTNSGELVPPPLHGSPIRRREARESQPGAEAPVERYLRLVTCERVAGCCCTADVFCTSPGFGDVYRTKCGVTLIVCPPTNPPTHDD